MTAMVLLALACWVMRTVFVLAVPADRLPARLQHGLAQLAPAVLAALVVAEHRPQHGARVRDGAAFIRRLGARLEARKR